VDPGFRKEKFGSGIRDGKNPVPERKKIGSGIRNGKRFGSRIRDKHPGSTTLKKSFQIQAARIRNEFENAHFKKSFLFKKNCLNN
jgi:hypothetical protein